MKIHELLKMDMGEVVDWLIENQHKYDLVGKEIHGKLIRDAKRWNTLLSSERIRVLGSSGLGSRDYQHFGMELWSKFPGGESDHGKHILTTYVDAIINDV